MGLYKRGKVWWYTHKPDNGPRVRRSTGLTNKKKADLQWAEFLADLAAGRRKPERPARVYRPWVRLSSRKPPLLSQWQATRARPSFAGKNDWRLAMSCPPV